MRAALLGSGGPVLGREYPLDADLVTIGRRDENGIVIKDPTVSRKHAEIRRQGDAFLVVDKNSTSGVLLNGVPISGEQRLKDGDRLGIGMSAVFLVRLQPAEETTVAFAQPQSGDRERTQFVTRTELDDPRGMVADPPPAAARATPAPAPARETPPHEAPAFAPTPAPTPIPMREAPPAVSSPATPGFSLPPAGSPVPPPTHSAAPPPPFSLPPAGSPVPPPTHSAAPPPPFSAAPAPPQYTPPQYTPPSAGQGNASWPAQESASAALVAPPTRSRRGLVIGLLFLVLIVMVALALVGLLIIRR